MKTNDNQCEYFTFIYR